MTLGILVWGSHSQQSEWLSKGVCAGMEARGFNEMVELLRR